MTLIRLIPMSIYYRFVSREFDRETRAVIAGMRRHEQLVRQGGELFELRRRVHMLEKGLAMRPRRDTFAVEYIEMTVDRFERVRANGALDTESEMWISDVLTQYFDATARSEDQAINESRRRFQSLGVANSAAFRGTELVISKSPAVGVTDFAELAHLRQTVRWFTDKPVSRDSVDLSVDIAVQAPTACNRVPYHFDIYDDAADARSIARIAGGTSGYADNIRNIIVVVGDQSAYPFERDRHLIYIDASLAISSLLMALRVQGIASCCINWPDQPGPERALRKLIPLKEYERVVMLIAYGFPDPAGMVPGSGKRSLASVRRYRSIVKHST